MMESTRQQWRVYAIATIALIVILLLTTHLSIRLQVREKKRSCTQPIPVTKRTDKTNHSFEIELDNGGVTMRNKRFLRHEYAPSNKRVSFAEDTGLENADSKEPQAPLTRSRAARKQVRNV